MELPCCAEVALRVRDEFLRGIGMTDQDVMRAARSPEQAPCGRKGGRLVN